MPLAINPIHKQPRRTDFMTCAAERRLTSGHIVTAVQVGALLIITHPACQALFAHTKRLRREGSSWRKHGWL